MPRRSAFLTGAFLPLPGGMRALERNNDIKREMHRRGENVLVQARTNATGVSVNGIASLGIPGPNNRQHRGPNIRTSRLFTSIEMAENEDALGVYVDVGTDVDYGRWLELGLFDGKGTTYPFLGPALIAAAF